MAQPAFRIYRRRLAVELVEAEAAYVAHNFRLAPIADLRGGDRLRVLRAAVRLDRTISRAFTAAGARRVS